MEKIRKAGLRVTEVYEIPEEIKRLGKKEKLALLKEHFKKELQGKTVTYEILGEERKVFLNKDTRHHYFWKGKHETANGYFVRLGIGANGELGCLVSGVSYKTTFPELKRGQNEKHRETMQWHYFTKLIQCDGDSYEVVVNVRETMKNTLYLHAVELQEVKGIDFGASKEATHRFKNGLEINPSMGITVHQFIEKVKGDFQGKPPESDFYDDSPKRGGKSR